MSNTRRARRTHFSAAFAACLGLAVPSSARAARPLAAAVPQENAPPSLPKLPNAKPRNVVFILTDDHRYDALGFLRAQPFIETPNLDALARGGVHVRNAFVTTSLCSPSRASILTGLYAHRHRVIDNNNPVPGNLIFFPQYLQSAGYQTAFFGKWHMGGDFDDPQRGFDRWVSFKGQGSYRPEPNGLNVDGRRVPQRGYITDELTSYALDWLRDRKGDRPFFMYLSHKGVHADFVPPDRYKGRAKDKPFTPPETLLRAKVDGAPMWVQNQRNSWHGVDYPYHSDLDLADYYRQYAETLLGVDDSVGRVVQYLREKGLLDSTLIVYMGDNGFAFGEHGLIDKRTAYEASMRVPMVVHCPELFKGGAALNQVIANIDVAPTILEAAGLEPPRSLDGRSFLSLAEGRSTSWRDALLYEYYWERNWPQTPTMHALRSDRYKYIHYYGIWDSDELYDLQADPHESKNLIRSPEFQPVVRAMNKQLFDVLAATDGMYIPLNRDMGPQFNLRRTGRSGAAEFPPALMRPAATREPLGARPPDPEKPDPEKKEP